ncbi:MAG: Crp/Fnr family transcriptional regulator [Clostridiales bacterium]|jgi:CRP/FNR family transcriptional regulator|nr:Crp/Fnr family transcriptional regulator [Clostridiales bacterium]
MLAQDNLDFLKSLLPFWGHLSGQEAGTISTNTNLHFYSQGQNVHSAGNECVGVLIVKSGELRTYILSQEGKTVTLYRLGPGEVCILSAPCLLSNITFDVFIDAEQDTEVLLINSSVFSKLMGTNVYIENFALRQAADRFSDVMWAMEQILFMKFDSRLAVFLLDEISATEENTVPLTHEQIAKYMGSAREVVSRMLKRFSEDGIVKLYRGGVKVIDKGRLRELSRL